MRVRRTISRRRPARRHGAVSVLPSRDVLEAFDERFEDHGTSALLCGGDVDADWAGALSVGDEAVGGSAPTPDQDVVEEIGRALGVDQPADAEVYTSGEILRARDRHYWHLEREAAARDEW